MRDQLVAAAKNAGGELSRVILCAAKVQKSKATKPWSVKRTKEKRNGRIRR